MCVMQYMEAESITDAVVVAHSVSGVWLQLLLGQVPERISRACFLNAVVLKSGESFISNAVGPAQVILLLIFEFQNLTCLRSNVYQCLLAFKGYRPPLLSSIALSASVTILTGNAPGLVSRPMTLAVIMVSPFLVL